jgi:putative PIN family toxin of toxin-antitoxin system
MIRAVLDTNVLVSALLRPFGTPGAILRSLRSGCFTIVFSPELLDELTAVLQNPRIRTKYGIDRPALEAISGLFALRGEMTMISETVQICRDPDDDFLLETAVAGRADYIVSGDVDLLILRKFRKTRIIKGRAFGSPLTRGLKPRVSTAKIPPGKPGALVAVNPRKFLALLESSCP